MSSYQLAFLTPGIFPSEANFLKHILQRPNLLIYPLGLPQMEQRFLSLTLNFGSLFAFSMWAFLGI
jgi:hypothetical protein